MAYGSIAPPKLDLAEALPVFTYPLPGGLIMSTHAVHGEASEGVMRYLHGVFSAELEDGRTYPQEGPMDYDAFRTYFFSSTTIVAVIRPQTTSGPSGAELDTPRALEEAIGGRPLEEAIAGCYYIKPNYPGRSSHNCNGGFLVPPIQRGKKIGTALAKSFLEYAPRLGYRASVFNLVYNNNAASLRLWDSLGFTRVGVIPGAGRLRTADGKGEEYVDAVIVHKSFV